MILTITATVPSFSMFDFHVVAFFGHFTVYGQNSLVTELFETLRELGSLLLVRADNIKSLCEEGRLVCLHCLHAVSSFLHLGQATIDQQSLHAFLQIRVDYKTAVMPAFVRA